MKDELQATKIAITCYDKDGVIVKRVTSADTNDVEDENGLTPDPSPTGEGDNSLTPSPSPTGEGSGNTGGESNGGGFESGGD